MKIFYIFISLLVGFNAYALGCCGQARAGLFKREEPSFPSLIDAVIKNDLAKVQFLLDDGEDVNVKDTMGLTGLMHASALGNRSLVKLLLERGADIHARAEYDDDATCLFYAIRTNQKEMVQLLIENGADIHAKANTHDDDKLNLTPIVYAAAWGHKEIVQLLLDKGGILKQKHLYLGAFTGSKALVELILELAPTIDVNAKDKNGDTCLLYAIISGDKDTVKLLLEKGADKHIINNKKSITGLECVFEYKKYDLIPLFLMSKEELAQFKGEESLSDEIALILAIAKKDKNKVQHILEKGVDINKKDNEYGLTYLHYAALRNNIEMLELLIDNGADEDARDKNGRTYFEYMEHLFAGK